MRFRWRENKIAQHASALMVAGFLATVSACRAVPEQALLPSLPALPPVGAPLAPAAPGTVFAPSPVAAAPVVPDDPPPASTGTHITASLTRGDNRRLVAVWGDPILWEQIGKRWRPAPGLPRLTGIAAEVIAIEQSGAGRKIVIATRREGRFAVQNGVWTSLPRPNLPRDANAQALAAYRGALFVATLNDGLSVRDARGAWGHVGPPTLSSDAPRQFLIWKDALYVRHGSGAVDRFDGRVWTRDVFTRLLPRRQVSAMATDGATLFLAQWGGWSETGDGRQWAHRFSSDLRALPITALLPIRDRGLYVGTQGRGLAECDRETGTVRRWHDERAGIADDWITSLAQTDSGTVVVGTFVSGAFRNAAGASSDWQPVAGTENDCVTGTAVAGDAVLISLRRGGIRHFAPGNGNGTGTGAGTATALSTLPEAQCLLPDPANRLVWVGARTRVVAVSFRVFQTPCLRAQR